MKIIRLNNLTAEPVPCVATIGMFDGVHRGHRFVIGCLLEEAARRQMPSCVVTFDRHPRQVVGSPSASLPSKGEGLLSSLDEKLLLLSQTQIDLCVVLPFTKEMAGLSARHFMQRVLKERLGVRVLLTGYDNHFGHRSVSHKETFEDYQRYGREMALEVRSLPQGGGAVSSSFVRGLLAEGHIEEANEALGYPYTVRGRVVGGEQVGRHLGFPTANLQPDDPCKLLPARGVYAVKVQLEGSLERKHAVTNIGCRPTFGGQETTLETHILHHRGELYDQQMAVSFLHRLRDEQRFDSPEALAAQLHRDVEATEKLFNQDIEE